LRGDRLAMWLGQAGYRASGREFDLKWNTRLTVADFAQLVFVAMTRAG
jgi:hypothetical protein